MKDTFKMLAVLSVICGVCGLLLAAVQSGTKERITSQILKYKQGPAVKQVLSGSDNDLIADRVIMAINGKEIPVFIGRKSGKPWAFAFETEGNGFGGKIGVITGFGIEDSIVTGIGITTHKETAGLGARVAEETFTSGFRDKEINGNFAVRADGGIIDAVSGATISSRGVCAAVRDAVSVSNEVKNGINSSQGD